MHGRMINHKQNGRTPTGTAVSDYRSPITVSIRRRKKEIRLFRQLFIRFTRV